MNARALLIGATDAIKSTVPDAPKAVVDAIVKDDSSHFENRRFAASTLGALTGGAVGWKVMGGHPFLGIIGGAALAEVAVEAVELRAIPIRGVCRLGAAGSGIAGSLMWKKHPFWGFLLGSLVGDGLISLVPGSEGAFAQAYRKFKK